MVNEVMTVLQGDPKLDAVKASLVKQIEAALPRSKAFIADGIVEVNLDIKTKELADVLRSENDKLAADKKLLQPAEMDDLAKRLGDKTLSGTGYASLSRKPVDGKALVAHVAIDPKEMGNLLVKPDVKTEIRPLPDTTASSPATGGTIQMKVTPPPAPKVSVDGGKVEVKVGQPAPTRGASKASPKEQDAGAPKTTPSSDEKKPVAPPAQ
jgi:hypothetical protein